MRTYLHNHQCVICGYIFTPKELASYRQTLNVLAARIAKGEETPPAPPLCCRVPGYVGLRDFATLYYGETWYRNPKAPWTQTQLARHFQDVQTISDMYHAFRFGNYSLADLTPGTKKNHPPEAKFFIEWDAGEVIIARRSPKVFRQKWAYCALDPSTTLGKAIQLANDQMPNLAPVFRADLDADRYDHPDVEWLQRRYCAIEWRESEAKEMYS